MLPRESEPRTKVCPRCPEKGPQPWENFHARKRSISGATIVPASYCKPCSTAVAREYKRSRGPEWRREINRRYWAEKMQDPERTGERNAKRRERRRGSPTHEHEPRRLTRQPAAPIRAAVESSGLPLRQIAVRAGYKDEGSVRHALGRDTMQLRTAKRILAAIDVLPAEVGL